MVPPLGCPGETDHPDVREAVETIRSNAVDTGVPVGCLGFGIDDVNEKATNGYQMLNLGSTTGVLEQTVTGWFDAYESDRPRGDDEVTEVRENTPGRRLGVEWRINRGVDRPGSQVQHPAFRPQVRSIGDKWNRRLLLTDDDLVVGHGNVAELRSEAEVESWFRLELRRWGVELPPDLAVVEIEGGEISGCCHHDGSGRQVLIVIVLSWFTYREWT